jgi:hypothetical protein
MILLSNAAAIESPGDREVVPEPVASRTVPRMSHDDPVPAPGALPAVAGWVLGAPDEIRDAHYKALIWCQATQTQIHRVRLARLDFMAAHERAVESGRYGDDEHVEPPRRMEADILMMFIAARQLLRALRRFDATFRVPDGIDRERVRQLRNALEHWDQAEGESIEKLRAANVDPKHNRWRPDGSGIVGDLDDRDLEAWAKAVLAEICLWDPYDNDWLKERGYPTGVVLEGGQIIQ